MTLCKKVYVCVRVCVCDPAECKAGVLEPKHTLIHTLVYTRKHTHKHAYKHAHSDAHAHAHARTNTHIHTYMHTHTHTHTGLALPCPQGSHEAHRILGHPTRRPYRCSPHWADGCHWRGECLYTVDLKAVEKVSASILHILRPLKSWPQYFTLAPSTNAYQIQVKCGFGPSADGKNEGAESYSAIGTAHQKSCIPS